RTGGVQLRIQIGLVQEGHDGIGGEYRRATMMDCQSLQVRVLAMTGGAGLIAQIVERAGQLVVAGHQLLELLVADIAQLQRPHGSAQPIGKTGRFLDRLERCQRRMEALDDDPADHLDHSLRAVDAGIVVLVERLLQRFQVLLQHWRVAPVAAGLADAGAPVRGHACAPPNTNLARSRRSISKGVMKRRFRPMQAFGILMRLTELAGTSWVTTTWPSARAWSIR